MKKNPNSMDEKDPSWLDKVAEDYDYTSMATDYNLTEDPEFPSLRSKKNETDSTLYSDVERKKEEIDNSTVGGF